MLFHEVAVVSREIASEGGRTAKAELVAGCLRRADPAEATVLVAYLAGALTQRQIGVGPAALRALPEPADTPSLTLLEVDTALEAIGTTTGAGSQAARRALIEALFARATAVEQRFLVGLLVGEVRQGALDGVMADAVARAAEVPVAAVRRALMLRGAAGPVAAAALAGGKAALAAFTLQVGHPVRPMLAASAPDVPAALAKLRAKDPDARVALEWKIDGIRVQIHRDGDHVAVFTRSLDDITTRVPELVEAVRALPVRTVVLDGEAIALRPDGRPHPFQITASRTGTHDAARLRAETPLTVYLFDALHVDGADLIDRPGAERWAALEALAPAELLVPRLVTGDDAAADAFFADAVARGHEGVMVKSSDTPYTAGRRGAGWVKVKPRHTLDLVVLAAEWGHGRRRGTLSNLHLGARDPGGDGFVMLGKTFKGLTDELLAWQTERLQEMAVRRDDWTVWVRPELVVEIAFDGLQTSTRYPGGLALRFARVLRYREDKTAAEADDMDTVRALAAGD
ncbi:MULTISPECIES: ATP-dependent DNA ligase [Streptomycetaceae]|uniref:ATP-dependent DNA ligase n=1 Tax=Embleya scabrispora TaxID=159449 RepID=UPI000592A5BE|nr:ATP-dependent DNA ligase [Embleya scabrispora]MYS83656.1 ATP-dependent DNA ligase [Streptomyces sp. SID5474]